MLLISVETPLYLYFFEFVVPSKVSSGKLMLYIRISAQETDSAVHHLIRHKFQKNQNALKLVVRNPEICTQLFLVLGFLI